MKPRRKTWIPLDTFERLQSTGNATETDSVSFRSASNPLLSLHRQWSHGACPQRAYSEALAHLSKHPLEAAGLQKVHEQRENKFSNPEESSFQEYSSIAFLNPDSGCTSAISTPSTVEHQSASERRTSLDGLIAGITPSYENDLGCSALPISPQRQSSSESRSVAALGWEDILLDPIYFADWARGSDDMATVPFRMADARRSNRYENRPPMSTVLCRNGPQCRKLQEGTCHYNHDFGSVAPNGFNNAAKKSLSVESPAFTPKIAHAQPVKNVGISPKAVAAAAFTPRGSGTVTPAGHLHSKEPSIEFVPGQAFQPAQQFQEFVPGQTFLGAPQVDAQAQLHSQLSTFNETFLAQPGLGSLDAASAQINPYAQQTGSLTAQQFFQDSSSFRHPLNYHLYSSIGPRRENLMAYQRSTTDFFIPDDLREELQRKAEATLQTFANSTLPQTVEHFHSLVALDINNAKGQATFGYPSWIYKAISARDGHTYALRRIEGFRLTSEASIRTINSWKRLNSPSMVQIHDAFTGRWFGDSSLILVTDYHPRSQTLAEKYFAVGRSGHRPGGQIVPENDLWGYIIQLASALKTVHDGGLASQTVVASKVLITAKNRLRLNGCGVLDILKYDQRRPASELQRADLQDLGRLILAIAARNPAAHQNTPKALELVSRSYSERLRSCIAWLVAPPPLPQDTVTEQASAAFEYNVHALLTSIADKVVSTLDSTLHYEDELTNNLMHELENGRLVRLLAKMNIILERPDTSSTPNATTNPALLNQPGSAWSETGERYYLKLFRDFVFHQVDQDGRPVLDLGHIITCLNKLDAGIDEKIQLISRDEQSVFITTYKEVKRGFESAWVEIGKAVNPARR